MIQCDWETSCSTLVCPFWPVRSRTVNANAAHSKSPDSLRRSFFVPSAPWINLNFKKSSLQASMEIRWLKTTQGCSFSVTGIADFQGKLPKSEYLRHLGSKDGWVWLLIKSFIIKIGQARHHVANSWEVSCLHRTLPAPERVLSTV